MILILFSFLSFYSPGIFSLHDTSYFPFYILFPVGLLNLWNYLYNLRKNILIQKANNIGNNEIESKKADSTEAQ